MERKNKACWNCYHYVAYYTKGYCCFNKKGFGNCICKRRDTNSQDVCENWKDNSPKEERRIFSAQNALLQICEDLAVLKQIFIEESERTNKNG